jgi:hypothetical protein
MKLFGIREGFEKYSAFDNRLSVELIKKWAAGRILRLTMWHLYEELRA